MCGIIGSYNFSNEKILKLMLKKIKHRGPDDTNAYVDEKCML